MSFNVERRVESFPCWVLARIIFPMSPTVFREGLPFLFLLARGNENACACSTQNGEAKFWLEPAIGLAQFIGLSRHEINEALRLVQEHENDIRSAWHTHFHR